MKGFFVRKLVDTYLWPILLELPHIIKIRTGLIGCPIFETSNK